MTLDVDIYYTMRSPYCYLATLALVALCESHKVHFNLKPLYPLAVNDPSFFETVNPLWPPYVGRDTRRIAERLGIPFRRPRPDPIVQAMATRAVATEQPYIQHITRLAQVAAERGRGLEYVASVSTLLHDPAVDGWNGGEHLANAVARAGLDLTAMDAVCARETDRLEVAIAGNREDQLAAGHWGAPLFVHDGEILFGQDRIDDLIWHLETRGLESRPEFETRPSE